MADGWVDETPSGGWPWETAVPGPDLAAAVAAGLADAESLPGRAWPSLLKAASRVSGWASMAIAHATIGVIAALEADDAAARSPQGEDVVEDWAHEEVATALHVAPNTASRRISAARALVQRWPSVGAAVASGRVSWAQGLTITEGVVNLAGRLDATGRDLADVAVERILVDADRYPPARLAQRVEALVVKLDADATARRRRRALREQTDVGLWADRDGLATVFVRGAAPDAIALNDAIAARAKQLRGEVDAAGAGSGGCPQQRTAGQWRVAAAMAAFGLQPLGMPPAALPAPAAGEAGATAGGAVAGDPIACGPAAAPVPAGVSEPVAAPAQVPVQVRVTVDIATLLGLANDPAILDGYGPIDPDLARELAADGDWVRWVTDPVTGYLLDAGTRRLPGAKLARFITSRDGRCAHPSCGVRARNCDIDHVPEYRVSGRTRADELTVTCPKHNRSRDAAGWSAKPADWGDPSAGPEPTWTTPLGQRYRSLTDPVLPIVTVPPGRVPHEHAPPDDPPY